MRPYDPALDAADPGWRDRFFIPPFVPPLDYPDAPIERLPDLEHRVLTTERFGVAAFRGGRITGIEEKPRRPKSRYAVTGIYMYDNSVFDKIKTLEPSSRGELEITDVNNHYLRQGRLRSHTLKGYWTDAGTLPSLHVANELVRQKMPQF